MFQEHISRAPHSSKLSNFLDSFDPCLDVKRVFISFIVCSLRSRNKFSNDVKTLIQQGISLFLTPKYHFLTFSILKYVNTTFPAWKSTLEILWRLGAWPKRAGGRLSSHWIPAYIYVITQRTALAHLHLQCFLHHYRFHCRKVTGTGQYKRAEQTGPLFRDSFYFYVLGGIIL